MAGDNKLTFDPPIRLSELTQNVIRSSHGQSTPSLKISCKSVQPFSRTVADKETTKETKKEIARETIPRPPTGGGVIIICINSAAYSVSLAQSGRRRGHSDRPICRLY